MARHRHIRTIREDDLEHHDDIYGHSVDDDYGISPETASTFMYNRNGNDRGTFGEFVPNQNMQFSSEDFPDQADDFEDQASSPPLPGINRTPTVSVPSSRMARRQAPPWQRSSSDEEPIEPEECMPELDLSDDQPTSTTLPGANNNGDTGASAAVAVDKPVLLHHMASLQMAGEVSTSGRSSPRNASPMGASRVPAPQLDRSSLVRAFEDRCRSRQGKATINLIVIGHVDAGKSTLMGNVLCQLGSVSERQINKYKWDAQKQGKSSFAYAWVLDQTTEERNRGVTMDISQTAFETPTKQVVLLDAPGHKDFIPNMISGAVQADAAVLVINATRGEFETGFEMGGQTREHAQLVRSLGVSQLIVAVNKMDTEDWSEDRYNTIKRSLLTFFRTVRLTEETVQFCPVSGLLGVNLTSRGKVRDGPGPPPSWYSGPTLIDCIDNLREPERSVDEPFRFTVSDLYKPAGSGIVTLSGRIEAGGVASPLAAGLPSAFRKVLCMPANQAAQVKAIFATKTTGVADDSGSDDQQVAYAFAGDYVSIQLTGVDSSSILCQGSMLCDPSRPVPCTNQIKARLLIFNVPIPITKGFQVLFHYQCQNIMATIKRLLSYKFKESKQEVTKKNPRCLHKTGTADVVISLDKIICIEMHDNFKSLGKFTLRSGGQTIAGGTVLEVLPVRGTTKADV